MVSRPQIAFKSKAQADEKAQSRCKRDELREAGLQRSYWALDGISIPLLGASAPYFNNLSLVLSIASMLTRKSLVLLVSLRPTVIMSMLVSPVLVNMNMRVGDTLFVKRDLSFSHGANEFRSLHEEIDIV